VDETEAAIENEQFLDSGIKMARVGEENAMLELQ